MNVPQRFGRFEVLAQLGMGGQGAVLRARDSASGQEVALKLLLRVDAKSERRFRQEAQVMAALQHPGVVRALDWGVEGGVPWLAMPLVQGESLKSRVEKGGPLAPAEAARIVADLSRAVAHCHERGIVHRDLKPENVLLERASGRPVLVDFGLLRRDADVFGALSIDERSRLSKTGDLRGTPAYMSPEQVNPGKFGQVGPTTDVYALGGVLCFLLTGEPAYSAESLPGLMVKILEGERVDVRARRSDVPRELSDVCARALALEPAQRFESAEALAVALEEAVGLRRKRRARVNAGSRRAILAAGAIGAVGALGAIVAGVALALRPSVDAAPGADSPSAPSAPGAPGASSGAPAPIVVPTETPAPPTLAPEADWLRPVEARRVRSDGDIVRLALRPGPRAQVAASSEDGRTRLWDLDTGELVLSVDHGATGPQRRAKSLAFSPDGDVLVTGGADHVLRRWDLTGSLDAPAAESRGLAEPVILTFSPDGATLGVTWIDGLVAAHDARTLEPRGPLAILGGPPHAESLSWDRAGRRCLVTIVSSGQPAASRWLLTDAATGATLREVWFKDVVAAGDLPPPDADGRGSRFGAGCFAGEDSVVVSVHNRTSLRVWDLRRDDPPTALEISDEVARVEEGLRYRGIRSLVVHDDLLVAGTHGGLLLGFSLRERALRWWKQAHDASIGGVVITPDGRRVVSAGADRVVIVWDLRAE